MNTNMVNSPVAHLSDIIPLANVLKTGFLIRKPPFQKVLLRAFAVEKKCKRLKICPKNVFLCIRLCHEEIHVKQIPTYKRLIEILLVYNFQCTISPTATLGDWMLTFVLDS